MPERHSLGRAFSDTATAQLRLNLKALSLLVKPQPRAMQCRPLRQVMMRFCEILLGPLEDRHPISLDETLWPKVDSSLIWDSLFFLSYCFRSITIVQRGVV